MAEDSKKSRGHLKNEFLQLKNKDIKPFFNEDLICCLTRIFMFIPLFHDLDNIHDLYSDLDHVVFVSFLFSCNAASLFSNNVLFCFGEN